MYYKIKGPIGTLLVRQCNRLNKCECFLKYQYHNHISWQQFQMYQDCQSRNGTRKKKDKEDSVFGNNTWYTQVKK